jgi:hypothetical protein
MSLSFNMQINGREVKAVYLKGTDLFYVELLLGRGDCPEKREFPDVQVCPGDCQGTYLSAVIKDDVVRIIGSIYPKPHIMYNQEFVRKHSLKKEEVAEYVKDYLKNNPCTIKSYMAGRKKRIYVRGEHLETLFEQCVFRVAQGEFTPFLTKLREKDLERITQRLPEIKKIAAPAKTLDFGKFMES